MEKQINDLPIDVWPFILRNLSIDDLFNCRLVSKKFKQISDFSYGIEKLVLINREKGVFYHIEVHIWSNNRELIDRDFVICFNFFKRMRSLFLNLDKTIKYLMISDDETNLLEISNLINLEYLEIRKCSKSDQSINLNKLRFLRLLDNDDVDIHFYLNTPELKKLDIRIMDNLHFNFNSNPELIDHVLVNVYSNKLKIFKNLEILQMEFLDGVYFDENLLSDFKNLKKLIINSKLILVDFLFDPFTDKFKKYKLKFKKDIDIYLQGVKIVDFEQLKNIETCRNWIEFQIKYIDLFEYDQFSQLGILEYYHLENFSNNLKIDIPSSCFDKFSRLTGILFHEKVKNPDDLYWFLKNLKNPFIHLTIKVKYLDQSFYDNLPDAISSLRILTFNINFDFIFKLTKLTRLYIESNKDLIDFALRSFLELKNLKIFYLYFNNAIKINRSTFYGYELESEEENVFSEIFLKTVKKKLTYDQLVDLCQKYKDDPNNKKNEINNSNFDAIDLES